MSKEPKALQLAKYWETRANDLQTWVDENDYVEFGYRPEGLKREQEDQRHTASELRCLYEVNQMLITALELYVIQDSFATDYGAGVGGEAKENAEALLRNIKGKANEQT